MELQYFHGNITKEQCEELLSKARINGSFLLRDSESIPGALCLCVFYEHLIYTYRIFRKSNGHFMMQTSEGTPKYVFRTLKDLIDKFKKPNQGLVINLCYPVNRSPCHQETQTVYVTKDEAYGIPGKRQINIKVDFSMEEMLCVCNNLEEPPVSAVLLENCHFSQVIFANIEKFYVPGTDIICYYNLSQHFTPRKKDWVGIFKVGWKTTREYYTFMWAPLPSSSESSNTEQQQVLFKAYYLPKDDEYYQFCYVDQEGQIRGASVPFQFRTEAEDDMLVVTTQGEVEEIEQQNAALLQENQTLKKNLVSLQEQNGHLQEELVAAKVLQIKVNTLESRCEKLESQKEDLEKEKCAIKAELMQIREEKESILSEKEQLENRLRAILSQIEELQLQVQSQQKEVDNLQETIKDKASHLEQLKEENCQLNSTLLRQQILDEIKEEQTLALQILKKEKDEIEQENQKLWQENEKLKTRLPEIGSISAGVLSQSSPNSVLRFGNPYSASSDFREMGLVSMKKCPLCQEVFPNDIGEEQYSDHVQNHILDCPYCNKTFDSSNKQVYDDHVFCHRLDQV